MAGRNDYRIKPSTSLRLHSPALRRLVHSAPADIVGMFGGVHEAEPGDVLVAANDAFTGIAVVGDLAIGMMKIKTAGFVTDGLARQSWYSGGGLPVSAKVFRQIPLGRTGLGIVGAPVTLGGVHVNPGDSIVIGDPDSVVVVPLEKAEAS